MKDSEIPEIVSWPIADPMRPFLARTEMESIYQRVANPAPEAMVRNYDFVRNNLLRASSHGLLQIEVHEAGKSWIPYESYQSQNPGGDYEISYEDSEVRGKEESGGDWVEARIEKAGLGAFVTSIEAGIEARQKQSKRIDKPDNPLRDNQSPSPESFTKNIEQASLQNLIELMESVFREIKLSSEEPKAAASNAEPPKDQQSPQEQTATRKGTTARFPSPPNLMWDDVTITFFQNDAVKINAKDIEKKYTFAEMGFKDGRKGDAPNSRWNLLRDGFAVHGGTLKWEADISNKEQNNLKKTASDIGKTLRTFFGMVDSPLYRYHKSRGYTFKLNLLDHRIKEREDPPMSDSGLPSSDISNHLEAEADYLLEEDNGVRRAYDPSKKSDDY